MAFHSASWRTEQRSASRAVYVALRNTTGYTLLRTSYAVDYGVWSAFPPERIPPNSTAEFGCQSSFMTGCGGFVRYVAEGSEGVGEFNFSWLNPLIGARSCSAAAPNEFFHIQESTSMNTLCEIVWVIESQTRVRPSEDAGRRLSSSSGLPAPIHKAPEWKTLIAKSSRSIILTIDNKTRHTLKRVDQELGAGGWALFPPEEIGPNSTGGFACHSRGIMGGVYGKIVYSFTSDNKGRVQFNFNNPFIGISSFDANSNDPAIVCTVDAVKANQANVTFTIASARRAKSPGAETSAKMKILSLNTGLNITRDGALPPRAKQLAKLLNSSSYDVICLQGLYHERARALISSKLKINYPYQIMYAPPNAEEDHYTNGMLIASKFPALKHAFKLFGNGVGADALAAKGVLCAQFDLSSVAPRKILYLFTAHLQSDPANLSDLTALESAQKVRKEQAKLLRQYIARTLFQQAKGNLAALSDFAVVLCGDFVAEAEVDCYKLGFQQVSMAAANAVEDVRSPSKDSEGSTQPNTEESTSVSAVQLAEFGTQINSGQLSFTFASDLAPFLAQNKVPVEGLGLLRQKAEQPRARLLLLIALVAEVVSRELLVHLKGLVKDGCDDIRELKKIYVNQLSFLINCLCADLRLLLSSRKLEHDPIYAGEGESDINAFWDRVVLPRIKEVFGEQSLSEEEQSSELIRREIYLYPYQILRAFALRTGLMLKVESKERLFGDVSSPIENNDVSAVDFDEPSTLWIKLKDHVLFGANAVMEAINVDIGDRIKKSPEFTALLEILECRDLFREKNPRKAGFTILGAQNSLVAKKDAVRRCDFIFSWDRMDDMALLPLRCLDCKVIPFGDTADSQLCPHFAVGARLGF